MAKETVLNPAWLKGLTFRTSVPKPTKKGERTKVWNPVERDLTAADVMSCREDENVVVIVARDGMKYTIDKNAEKAEAEAKANQKADAKADAKPGQAAQK